jgi:outer membrane protein assembly factor BamB
MDGSATLVGDLLVFRTNGRMTAIDLITMQHVWTSQPLGTAFTSGAVAIHSGRLYAYTDDGRVVGLGAVG